MVKHQAIKTGISGYLSTTDNENKWTEIIGLPLNTLVLKSHLGVVRENVLVKFTQDGEKH